jgi:hypothetical protein
MLRFHAAIFAAVFTPPPFRRADLLAEQTQRIMRRDARAASAITRGAR